MFWKLCVLILTAGLIACSLLAMRQARLQSGHELAEARLRIAEHDARLLALRAQIAEASTPEAVLARLETTNATGGFTSLADDAAEPMLSREELIEMLRARVIDEPEADE